MMTDGSPQPGYWCLNFTARCPVSADWFVFECSPGESVIAVSFCCCQTLIHSLRQRVVFPADQYLDHDYRWWTELQCYCSFHCAIAWQRRWFRTRAGAELSWSCSRIASVGSLLSHRWFLRQMPRISTAAYTSIFAYLRISAIHHSHHLCWMAK